MVKSVSNSVLSRFPWEYNVLFLLANFIVLIVVVSLCAWCCWKRKEASQSEDDEKNVEEDDEEGNDTFEATMPWSRRSLLGNSGTLTQSTSCPSFPPNDYARRHSSIELQQPNRTRRSLRTSLKDSLAPFYNIHLQPTYEEFLPFDSPLGRSVSVPDLLPEAPDSHSASLGSIYFSISYDVYELVLQVLIQKATNLPAKDITGTSDPYVKILLLPDKKQKLETRIKKKNLNPTWNEVLCFEGFPHHKLVERTVYLQVLDYDRFSRDDAIGEVELPLVDVPLQNEPVQFEKQLRPCKHHANGGCLGDLLISMCYNPSYSRVSVVVMKCAHLKSMDVSGKSDPYVKVYLLYSGKRIDKKKTEIIKRSLDPVWNELMEFEVPFDKIREISFVLTVMDFDAILPNKHIGQVILGYRSSGTSLKHWTDVLHNPRKPVAMWHKIIKY